MAAALCGCAIVGSSFAAEPAKSTDSAQKQQAAQSQKTQDAAKADQSAQKPKQKLVTAKTFRSSHLTGMTVRNAQGEALGKVDDLVINVETGKIDYAALSHGGVLGIGDKLFAVPWNELQMAFGQDENYFVLNMSKEKLEAAPGFNKDAWPNFADANWSQKIDQYYRKATTEKTTTTERTR